MELELTVALKKYISAGVSEEQLAKYDVMILPENLEYLKSSTDQVNDAQDAIRISKLLKQANVNCANSYDLGIETPTLERRSNDIWFGEIFIIKDIVIPFVVSVLSSYLTNMISEKKKKEDKRSPTGNVHTEITIARPEGLTSIKYNGDAETFIKLLESLKNENKKELE